jgi:hypothetical protein
MGLSYVDSCKRLQDQGFLDTGELPSLPDRPPRHDDKQPGVSFFRINVESGEFDGLTLPRTFIGRCDVVDCSFRDADLSESTFNWNDFFIVDFRGASLASSDLRASNFEGANFSHANLCGADLRRATFRGCKFRGAKMAGAKLVWSFGWLLRLSREQRSEVDWRSDRGPAPEGG